jgi:hypothetical protein
MRQIHRVPARTERQQILELLAWLQILCARESSLGTIWEVCEQAIEKLNGRH